jgi:hypothetical protein
MQFLQAALQAIPEAAKSPLAFLAYSVALLAWVIISFRVARNKQLLRNLEKLPLGDRLIALQNEMGVLPLAEGLTPEQYLRSRVHRYYLLAFAMILGLIVFLASLAAVIATNRREQSGGFAPCAGLIVSGNAKVNCGNEYYPTVNDQDIKDLQRQLDEQRKKLEEIVDLLKATTGKKVEADAGFTYRYEQAMQQSAPEQRAYLLKGIISDVAAVNQAAIGVKQASEYPAKVRASAELEDLLVKRFAPPPAAPPSAQQKAPSRITRIPTEAYNCAALPLPAEGAMANVPNMALNHPPFNRTWGLSVQWYFVARFCILFGPNPSETVIAQRKDVLCEAAKVVHKAGLEFTPADFEDLKKEFLRVETEGKFPVARVRSCFNSL